MALVAQALKALKLSATASLSAIDAQVALHRRVQAAWCICFCCGSAPHPFRCFKPPDGSLLLVVAGHTSRASRLTVQPAVHRMKPGGSLART